MNLASVIENEHAGDFKRVVSVEQNKKPPRGEA